MIEKIIKAIFGDPSDKKVKEISKLIESIKVFEKKQENFNLWDIKQKTSYFKKMFKWLDFEKEEDSKKIQSILEDIKLEAFALVKTACKLINWRETILENWKKIVWNMIPYDVQLIGALAIHEWNISEMKTWEWKTLVATIPAYLNALTWNSVHIVTVNDYLAKRDSFEMWVLYWALGLKTGVVYSHQDQNEKKIAYQSDIVYATNNELWFDYLRDNMLTKKEDKTQSKLFFAIIDEVDSILIDEARTPLVISMPDNEPTNKYWKFAQLSKKLEKNKHYKLDEKQKSATLTEDWIKKVEELLHISNIYVSNHYNDIHHIENALKAVAAFIKDKDYLVVNGEVIIIDEHTGRALAGRRYSDWLHQALEAKERVEIQQESKTLASITFQNYFRIYWKLAWMTGTAQTEAEEFYKVYSLDTLVIPTNKPLIRDDRSDLLFKNEKWKFEYTIELIKEMSKTGQPILVWTVSVEKSEYLSSKLKSEWMNHNVLNAKQNKKEAEVIINAGQKWAITIATNMAWRWTDIKLWKWVKELWWLIVLWTEKHETRRIDNQLRWRSGRQWDPWITQYLISPNDDIMRIFWWDKLFSIFNSPIFASLPDNKPLTQSKMLTGKVTGVQKQVEWHNFDARKHILEYDDVMNKHRQIIYSKRNKILDSQNIDDDIIKIVSNQIKKIIDSQIGKLKENEKINIEQIISKINQFLDVELINDNIYQNIKDIKNSTILKEKIIKLTIKKLNNIKDKAKNINQYFELQRKIVLSSIDSLWMRHIDNMARLREQVAFEWYAQRNPLVEYKKKAFIKFEELIDELEYKTVKSMFSITKIDQIEEIHINTSDLEMEEINPVNPLFVNPKDASKNDVVKNRIRI